VFDESTKYHIQVLLGNFKPKVCGEDIFKPTIRNERLREISNRNGISVVKYSASKNVTVKRTMFPRRNIHKFH
jgi:hypothetical protein